MQFTAIQSALTAAFTAAFVTLAVEYAAKPSLEVRKDRILEQARAYRAIQAGMKRIFMLRGMMENETLVGLAPGRVTEILVEIQGAIHDVQAQLASHLVALPQCRASGLPSNPVGVGWGHGWVRRV